MSRHVTVSWAKPSMLLSRIDAEFYTPDALAEAAWIEEQRDRLCLLADRLELLTDGVHETPSFVDKGVLYLTASNIDPCHLNIDKGFKFTDEATYKRYDRMNSAPRQGDVLLSKSGRIGFAAVVPAGLRFSVLHSAAILRPREVDAYFLATFLQSHYGQTQISRFRKGAVQPMLHLGEIAEIRIPRTPEAIQRAIGNKVRKAERLRELAALWAASAQARMDQATVKFDAVPAQSSWIAARALTQRMDTQPYRTHFLSLRDALQGTSSDRLAETATVTGGDPVSSDLFALDGVPLVRIRDIQPGGFATPDVCVSPDYFRSRPTCAARPLRIVLGMDGEFRAQFFIEPDLPRFVNQRIAIIDCERIRPELLAAWLNRPEGQLQLARWTVQTTVAHTSLRHVRDLMIPRLAEDVENSIADSFLRAREAGAEAAGLVAAARQVVETLIDGTLDEPALLAEGEAIEQWLVENPSPNEEGGT